MQAIVQPLHLPPGRRVFVVSDIHGNLPFLKGLLQKISFSKADILIVLGDILEKSTGGLETLRYLMDLATQYTVYTVRGNCDNITPAFVDNRDDIPLKFFDFYFRKWGEKCAVVQMARLAGAPIRGPEDYPAARKAIADAFPAELAFLRAMPTILVNENYLLVHGGVPHEDHLENLDAYLCMKNDDFLGQGLSFRRWVIVGHWPVTLYHEKIASAKPILLPDRHIISIDGGCTLKSDGQLNALLLPERPDGDFFWTAYDGLPEYVALDDQAPSVDSINIRWGRGKVELLERGPEFSRCRHLETGYVLDVLNDYCIADADGIHVLDYTDYHLPVTAGDCIRVERKTSHGILAKRDGVTGWYFGRLREAGSHPARVLEALGR